MPGGEALLDTNALIALMRDEAEILHAVARYPRVAISLFTLGEMHFGAAKSSHPHENRRRLTGFLEDIGLLLPDAQTAELYGEAFLRLKTKGRPIPTNDVWIVALALQHSLPLLTRDTHFRDVAALNVVAW